MAGKRGMPALLSVTEREWLVRGGTKVTPRVGVEYTPDAYELSLTPLSTFRPKKGAAIKAVKQHVEAVLQRYKQHMQV
jgi:hypothetical protein